MFGFKKKKMAIYQLSSFTDMYGHKSKSGWKFRERADLFKVGDTVNLEHGVKAKIVKKERVK